jgi:hypothetical protein
LVSVRKLKRGILQTELFHAVLNDILKTLDIFEIRLAILQSVKRKMRVRQQGFVYRKRSLFSVPTAADSVGYRSVILLPNIHGEKWTQLEIGHYPLSSVEVMKGD